MSEITINLNDDPKVIRMFISMLQEFVGELPDSYELPAPVSGVSGGTPVLEDEELTVAQEVFGAPAVTEEPEVPTVLETELDSAGNPWDSRIHTVKRTKNQNGTWKLRRGVDKNLVAQIAAERAGGQHLANVAEAAVAEAVTQPATPATPITLPVTPAPVATTGATWPVVLQKVTAATTAGTLDQAKKDAFLVANGITGGIALLAARADLFDAFLAEMGL